MNEKINLTSILNIYEKEIVKKIKNKSRVYDFEKYKMQNISAINTIFNNNDYNDIFYNIFLISEPKIRIIMSLSVKDKLINHCVSRYILEEKLTKYLINNNVATRKNMGTSYALKLVKNYIELNKKHQMFYILKIDITKYFYNIDHNVLLSMLKNILTDYEYKLVKSILQSTNKDYINKEINNLTNKIGKPLPYYKYGKGLPIGSLTSQYLSIFYLYELDHYIVHNLHIKYYVRYMDDFILIHHNKEILKNALKTITTILNNKYKLDINENKTMIHNSKNGFPFLGYTFKVLNKKTIIKINSSAYNKAKLNLKKKHHDYINDIISFDQAFSSTMSYYNSYKMGNQLKIKRLINSIWFKYEK